MATHSSILARRILWKGEPGRLQSIGWQRIGHDWPSTHICIHINISLYLGINVSIHIDINISTHTDVNIYIHINVHIHIYRLCSVLDSPQGFEEHDHLLDAFYLFLKQSTHLGTWEFLLFINKITWVVDWWPYVSNWSYGLHASHHKEENMGHETWRVK